MNIVATITHSARYNAVPSVSAYASRARSRLSRRSDKSSKLLTIKGLALAVPMAQIGAMIVELHGNADTQ